MSEAMAAGDHQRSDSDDFRIQLVSMMHQNLAKMTETQLRLEGKLDNLEQRICDLQDIGSQRAEEKEYMHVSINPNQEKKMEIETELNKDKSQEQEERRRGITDSTKTFLKLSLDVEIVKASLAAEDKVFDLPGKGDDSWAKFRGVEGTQINQKIVSPFKTNTLIDDQRERRGLVLQGIG